MLLLYLSIIIIVLGIIFLLTSIEVRTVQVTTSQNRKEPFVRHEKKPVDHPARETKKEITKTDNQVITKPHPAPDKGGDGISPQREESRSITKESHPDIEHSAVSETPVKETVLLEGKGESALEAGHSEEENVFGAVLFEDRNSILDLESENINVEMDHALYQNLKRIGKGDVSVRDDAVYFHCEKKLYRYDFSRVSKVSARGDAMLLHVDTMDYPVLFLGYPGQSFIATFMDKYSLAKQG